MNKQHVVCLTSEQRAELQAMLAKGVASTRVLTRVRILLKADAGHRGPRLTDAEVAEAVEVSPRTVARVRSAFVAGGVEQALRRKPSTRQYVRKLDGEAEAALVVLACSAPPPGHTRWSVRLLADRMVAMEVVDAVSPETVRLTLKKTRSNRG